MPEGAEINIEVAASQAQISAGRSNFKLPTLPVEDFPTFKMPVQFTLTAADLRHQIDTTQFAISTEETRYYLNGIYFHKNDNGALAAVATDGHRLAMTIMDMPSGADQIPNIILPRKAVAEIRKMIGEDEGEVVVSLSETRCRLQLW